MADRRTKILDAAIRRFADSGFEITTVRELAEDVNILSGSLYYHFDTKEEILHEIVKMPVEQMCVNAIRIEQSPVDPEHKLVALLMLNIYELIRNQRVFSIIYSERKFFRKVPEFSYVVDAKRKSYFACKSILESGIHQGFFDTELDVYLTITTIMRMLNQTADWYRNEDITVIGLAGSYDLSGVVDFLLKFVLRAVRAPHRVMEPIPRDACEDLARFRTT